MYADKFVLGFGSYSRGALQPLGLDLPVYPVKGYSLNGALIDPAFAPQSTVLDETYEIAVTRFDDRIRVGGMAELGGFELRLNPRRRATLELVVNDLFPGGDVANATFWTGLRPMTPDGTPVLGGTRYGNLFFNTGHGAVRCAQALQTQADGFAVAFLAEAEELRAAGIHAPILILEGLFDAQEWVTAQALDGVVRYRTRE